MSRDREKRKAQLANLRPNPNLRMNEAAITHGATSARRLRPLREQAEREVRERWPWLDDLRCTLVAGLMARTALATRWLEGRGTVVSGQKGEVYPVARELEAWSKRLTELVRQLDQEAPYRGCGHLVEELH